MVARILLGSGHINAGFAFILIASGLGASLSSVISGFIAGEFGYFYAFIFLAFVAFLGLGIWFLGLKMIIAIVNEKGGSGKTSLAINLACKLSDEEGDRVAFIDTNPQKSGEFWINIRKAEKLKLLFHYENKMNFKSFKDFDSILIDT